LEATKLQKTIQGTTLFKKGGNGFFFFYKEGQAKKGERKKEESEPLNHNGIDWLQQEKERIELSKIESGRVKK